MHCEIAGVALTTLPVCVCVRKGHTTVRERFRVRGGGVHRQLVLSGHVTAAGSHTHKFAALDICTHSLKLAFVWRKRRNTYAHTNTHTQNFQFLCVS